MNVEKAKAQYFDQGYFVAGDAVEPPPLFHDRWRVLRKAG